MLRARNDHSTSQRRACVLIGVARNVPPGFVSLTENLMMVGIGLWMLLKPAGLGIGS